MKATIEFNIGTIGLNAAELLYVKIIMALKKDVRPRGSPSNCALIRLKTACYPVENLEMCLRERVCLFHQSQHNGGSPTLKCSCKH
jgi:hypothetical protein